jgi:hypothetical protein
MSSIFLLTNNSKGILVLKKQVGLVYCNKVISLTGLSRMLLGGGWGFWMDLLGPFRETLFIAISHFYLSVLRLNNILFIISQHLNSNSFKMANNLT